jgi:hypothetical protein
VDAKFQQSAWDHEILYHVERSSEDKELLKNVIINNVRKVCLLILSRTCQTSIKQLLTTALCFKLCSLLSVSPFTILCVMRTYIIGFTFYSVNIIAYFN